MATQPTHPTGIAQPVPAQTAGALDRGPGILERWQAHRAARQQARLISARNRRILAQWLRRTANRTTEPHPFVRRREALLHYRAAAVRTSLLEIATLLEHAHNPDPARIAALHDLLANGCDSPLYNPEIHPSELKATLAYIRSGL
jgi:hypothetical protein